MGRWVGVALVLAVATVWASGDLTEDESVTPGAAPVVEVAERLPAEPSSTISPPPARGPLDRADSLPPVERSDGPSISVYRAPRHRLWELSGDSPHPYDAAVGDHRPDRQAIRFDPSLPASLEVGDRVALPLPGQGEVVAVVERIETSASGSRSLHGSLEGVGDAYAMTLTQGRTALFGRITTPHGNFLLEGGGGAASIVLDDLDRLIDPNRTDERIPPPEHEEPA